MKTTNSKACFWMSVAVLPLIIILISPQTGVAGSNPPVNSNELDPTEVLSAEGLLDLNKLRQMGSEGKLNLAGYEPLLDLQ